MTQINDLKDEDLVRRAQQGSIEAFSLLYERYLPVVYRRVRYTIPETDVEDITQEVFVDVVRCLKGFRGDSQFRTWLRTLVNRKVADYYRHRNPADFQRVCGDNDEMEDELPMINSFHESTVEDGIIVNQALKRLPDRYQEVILLRFADDLPFLEIARQLGLTLEATKSLFRRAIAMLQRILEEAHV